MDFDANVDFVMHSNALDGIRLARPTVLATAKAGDKAGEIPTLDGKTVPGEVVTNHLFALGYLEAIAEEPSFPEDLIQRIHKELMQDVLLSAGEFREFDLKTGAVPAKQVAAHVKKFVEYLNSMHKKAKNPASFAWTMHHELARIQPFVQGNGRVSRLVYALLRMKAGLPLDAESFADREAYLARIRDYFKTKGQQAAR